MKPWASVARLNFKECTLFKHILLATDGSAASAHATAMAVNLARTQAAKLTAIHVIDPYPYMMLGEANPYGLQAYCRPHKKWLRKPTRP